MAKRVLDVEINANASKLNRGVNEAKKSVSSLESVAKKAGIAIAGAFAARAVISGIKNLVVNLGNTADRLLDLEQITGMNVERLQEYEHVAKIAGVNTEALANASMGLTQRLARATGEAGPLNTALGQLGISSKTASGELRNGADIMEDAISKLAEMDNVTERNVLGAQIFSGAWKDMAPILSMGADGIAKAREEAHRLGVVMDRETINKANAMRQEMERMQAVTQSLGRELAIMFIPTLTKLASGLTAVVTEINNATKAMGMVNRSENLTFWQKLGTHINMTLGLATGNAEHLARGLTNVVVATTEHKEKQEDVTAETINTVEATKDLIKRLGDIQALEKSIADAKTAYAEASSHAERVAAQIRINALEKELELINRIAQTRALSTQMGIGAPVRAQGIAPTAVTPTTGGFDDFVSSHIESLEKLDIKLDEARQSMIDWEQIATGAAASIGMGFMQMAQDGSKSVSDIIKQTLAQVTAQLISQIVATVPFPANIALAAGAGAMAGGLLNQVPAFADGAMVKSPTLAMFGEYPGARTNPEYALRQDQLKGLMGGMGGTITTRVSGQDLLIILNEAQRRNQTNY